ncbi:hypothetical protein [Tateyamaria sp.]|uniref:hypothetical protein n=1 Tax=Tateyamaria sp. TaxID=1929288 RepID=UPI00329A8342
MSTRRWTFALATSFLGVCAVPATASNQALFGTMAACRTVNASLATTMSELDQLGWQQITQRANRSKIAAHMAAGVHHTKRGFDRSDHRSMQQSLLGNAGRSSSKTGQNTSQLTIVYYSLGGSLNHQLVLWDRKNQAPNGETVVHARTCYIASPKYPSITAFAALAEPVPHLGFRRMKGQWVDPRIRRYWVTASHRQYPDSGLPFRPIATDFIRIEAQTARSN